MRNRIASGVQHGLIVFVQFRSHAAAERESPAEVPRRNIVHELRAQPQSEPPGVFAA
jgi:hypothetical protein